MAGEHKGQQLTISYITRTHFRTYITCKKTKKSISGSLLLNMINFCYAADDQHNRTKITSN